MSDKFNNIPSEFKNHKHWILWKLEPCKNGKSTKIPYQTNGYRASNTKPKNWSNYNSVIQAYNKGGYSRIGFEFSGSGITGIDLDHCFIDGKITEEAQRIVNDFNSYTEKSQSGEGIHILVKGTVPKATKKT